MSDLSTLWRQRAEAAEARIVELEADLTAQRLEMHRYRSKWEKASERVSFYKQSFNELQTVVTEQGEENARLREALAEARDHMDTTTDDLERRIKELLKPTRQVSLVSTSDYGDVLTNEKGSLTGQAQQAFQQTSGSSESYPKPAVLELKAGDGEVERSANTREDAGSNPAPRTHLEQSVQDSVEMKLIQAALKWEESLNMDTSDGHLSCCDSLEAAVREYQGFPPREQAAPAQAPFMGGWQASQTEPSNTAEATASHKIERAEPETKK